MTQSIRRSQFVITYGPGAILEGPQGPRMILSPDIGLFTRGSGLRPQDYEVSDQRMSQGLLSGKRIFRLPSNAELGTMEDQYIYRTRPFPIWKLCLNTANHTSAGAGTDISILYAVSACPVCGVAGRGGRDAIRLVSACPAGHLDEVDWHVMIHRGSGASCAQSKWYRWIGGGGALGKISIECPSCNRKTNLGKAYEVAWPCSGRIPEKEPGASPYRPGCDQNAKIIQRQASNLRIPELRTLFTVTRYTRLHQCLETPPVYSVLASRCDQFGMCRITSSELERAIDGLLRRRLIPQSVAIEIKTMLNKSWTEVERAVRDVVTEVARDYSELVNEEFKALQEASVNGVPPTHGPAPSSPVIFRVDPHLVRKIPGPAGRKLRITPILRLRTVTVQTGYRREVDTKNPATIADASFPDPIDAQQQWCAGVEFLGEGIYIMLDEDTTPWSLTGKGVDEWKQARTSPVYSTPSMAKVFRSSRREELDPLFVWWHTLSHLLVRAVSIEAGYSSASIRERVYIDMNGTNPKGGVLLYATQPGTEGTLGGLIALVPHFEEILGNAFDMVQTCSSDPLCIENRFKLGKYNGAACYACSLVSETSCEHRNMWLDRNVLMENSP